MTNDPEVTPAPAVIKTRACALCTVELNPGQAHLSKDHCLRDLKERLVFLRGVTQGMARELDWERTAIQATHRIAYIVLEHFAESGRVVLPRAKFETVNQGAGVTMVETENGDFEVVCVLPDEKKPEVPA